MENFNELIHSYVSHIKATDDGSGGLRLHMKTQVCLSLQFRDSLLGERITHIQEC